MVVPTTWNASPRDTKGQHSAFEASLIGTPVIDPRLPLESYAPYTRSTPVWHVPYIYMTKTVNTYTDVKCYNINPKQLNI